MQEITPNRMSLGGLSSVQGRFNEEVLDRKTEQRSKLRSMLRELNEANSKQESDLTAQLQDYEDKLDCILAEKKHTRGTFLMRTDSLATELSSIQSTIARADKELRYVENRTRKVEAQMNKEQMEMYEAFKYSLRPIEEATELLIQEKQTVEDTIASLTEEKDELEKKMVTLSSEESHYRKQIETLQNNKVELTTAFDTIKNKYPLEYDEIVKEIETKKKLTELKERKRKQASELREYDKRIGEMERDLAKATTDLEREERQRSTSRKRAPEEGDLLVSERYLKLRCSELQVPYIDKAVEEVAGRNGIDVSNFILKEQFKIMEHKELTFIERGKEQQEHAQSEIAKRSFEVEQHEQILLASMSSQESSPQLDRKLKDLTENLKKIRREAEYDKRQHACRIFLINKWKDQNRKCLLAPDNVNWPSDINIVASLKEAMKGKITSSEQLAAIDSILNRYIKALNQREGLANAASEIEVKAKHEIREKETYIKQLKSGISSLQFEREVHHKDYIRLLNLEKSTLKKFQDCKYEIEVERFRKISKKLQDSLNKKAPEFLKLQQALGEKNMKSFKDRELSRFKGELEATQRKVRDKLEDQYNNFGFWESQIQHFLEKSIASQIEDVNGQIKKLNHKIKTNENKLKIMIDAEDELKAKIETMLESKRKEINRHGVKIMNEHGGGVDLNRIGELKQVKSEAEEQLKSVESSILEERIRYGNSMENLEVDETKIKAKLASLRDETKIVVGNKKKAESLNVKLAKIDREMERLTLNEGKVENFPIEEDQAPSITLTDGEEVKALPETIESPFASPISMSIDLKFGFIKVKVNDEGASEAHKLFFKNVVPLLEGREVYRKNPGKTVPYDPLGSAPIESCGYSLKMITVNRHLTKLEIRAINKHGIEKDLLINQILAPSIPKHTLEMIAAKKKSPVEIDEEKEYSYEEMRRTGIFDYKSEAFIAKSHAANMYSFSVGLKNGVKVDLVCSSHKVFREIIDGINSLLKFSNSLQTLRYKFQFPKFL